MDLSQITESHTSENTGVSTPPRKRRRPALSCEECRKRKIKCDRTFPCKQCEQSRTALCSYVDNPVPPANHVRARPTATAQPIQHGGIPNHIRSPPSIASEAYSSSHTFSPNPVTLSDGGQTSNWTSPSSHDLPEDSVTHKALLDRIQNLEKSLALQNKQQTPESLGTAIHRRRNGREFVLELKELKGTVSKTRFFGSSHWMYSFGTVRVPQIPWS